MKEIAELVTGFERFQAKYFGTEPGLFLRLRKDQEPRTLIIACCDSRVDPAMLTGADPGDLFVVRNVANLVPAYHDEGNAPGIRSAIEFAIKGLEVQHIIVLGHSHCGGIQALMDSGAGKVSPYEFIDAWVQIAKRAKEKVLRELPHKHPAQQARACEQAAILVSLENLLSFPWIRERVNQKKLALHGWYFDIDSGELLSNSVETGKFAPLVARPAPEQAIGV
jgi:carbonic anhydrase